VPLPGAQYSVAGEGSASYVPLDGGVFNEKNLTEGPFVASVVAGGQTVCYSTFYSFGDRLGGDLAIFAALTGTDDDAPGYVRAMYAINPDNSIDAYTYLFVPDYQGILTMGESIASLCAFTALCLVIGLLVFRRKGLA